MKKALQKGRFGASWSLPERAVARRPPGERQTGRGGPGHEVAEALVLDRARDLGGPPALLVAHFRHDPWRIRDRFGAAPLGEPPHDELEARRRRPGKPLREPGANRRRE